MSNFFFCVQLEVWGEICSWRDVDSFFKEMRLSLCAFSQADQTEGCRGLRLSKSTSDVYCCWTCFLARFAEHGLIYGSIWIYLVFLALCFDCISIVELKHVHRPKPHPLVLPIEWWMQRYCPIPVVDFPFTSINFQIICRFRRIFAVRQTTTESSRTADVCKVSSFSLTYAFSEGVALCRRPRSLLS